MSFAYRKLFQKFFKHKTVKTMTSVTFNGFSELTFTIFYKSTFLTP